jgi:hypothetical protein
VSVPWSRGQVVTLDEANLGAQAAELAPAYRDDTLILAVPIATARRSLSSSVSGRPDPFGRKPVTEPFPCSSTVGSLFLKKVSLLARKTFPVTFDREFYRRPLDFRADRGQTSSKEAKFANFPC